MPERLREALAEIAFTIAEADRLQQALDSIKTDPGFIAGVQGWISVQGFAGAIEKIYSGSERAMSRIAKHVDGFQPAKDSNWHRELLRQMASEVSDVRPPLLSHATYQALNDLRSFRHRARNSYGSDFDPERVLEVAAEAAQTVALLRKDILALETALGKHKAQPDE